MGVVRPNSMHANSKRRMLGTEHILSLVFVLSGTDLLVERAMEVEKEDGSEDKVEEDDASSVVDVPSEEEEVVFCS